MKVLHIRMDSPFYSSDGIEDGFRQNNFEYESVYWQQLKLNSGISALRERCIKVANRVKPDVIFIHIQSEGIMDIETLKELNKVGFTVMFTEDVREVIWQEELMPELGLMLFTNMNDVRTLNLKGFTNVGYIPTSFNHLKYKPKPTDKSYGEIIFIGNNFEKTNLNFPLAKQRAEMVNFMQDTFGDRFQAYGRGFKNKMLNPEQEIEAYSNCKIAITHNHFDRKGYCSDRGFRAMGCGAFTIHQKYEGLDSDTLYGTSWTTFSQLKNTCVSALTNDFLRKKIAHQEYMNCLNKNTWYSRVIQIKKLIQEQYARA